MTLESAITRYLDDLTVARGRATKTVERYKAILGQLVAASAVSTTAHPRKLLSREHIEPFVQRGADASAPPSSPATRKLRRAAVRGLCRFLVREGHLPGDPTDGVLVPVVKSRSPGFLEPYEFVALLRVVDQVAVDRCRDRDRAIFILAFLSGLRVSELVGLNLVQVDLQAGRLHQVLRKGGKHEDIFLAPPAVEAVRRWLLSRERFRYSPVSPALFLADSSFRLSIRGAQRAFGRYVTAAGFTKRLTFHSLRHSFATALTGEVGIEIVSKLMGHASIATTQIYAHVNDPRARAAVDRLAEVTFGPLPAGIPSPMAPIPRAPQKDLACNTSSVERVAPRSSVPQPRPSSRSRLISYS